MTGANCSYLLGERQRRRAVAWKVASKHEALNRAEVRITSFCTANRMFRYFYHHDTSVAKALHQGMIWVPNEVLQLFTSYNLKLSQHYSYVLSFGRAPSLPRCSSVISPWIEMKGPLSVMYYGPVCDVTGGDNVSNPDRKGELVQQSRRIEAL